MNITTDTLQKNFFIITVHAFYLCCLFGGHIPGMTFELRGSTLSRLLTFASEDSARNLLTITSLSLTPNPYLLQD